MSMSQIEHAVVLILENRSFDSMLEWLYEEDTPVIIPPGAPDDGFRGLHSIDLTQFINSANIGHQVFNVQSHLVRPRLLGDSRVWNGRQVR